MDLTGHAGFETGDASEFASVYGTPSFHADYAHTGNYGMRCNPSSGIALVDDGITTHKRIQTYLYIVSTPTVDCCIVGSPVSGPAIFLTTTRELDLYNNASKEADGTTQLDTGQWYRLTVVYNGSSAGKIFLEGIEECSGNVTGSIRGRIGAQTTCSTDLYFDDYATDADISQTDLPNLLTLGARPNAEGTDDDNYTLDEDGWADSSEAADAVYTELTSDPPSTASYDISYGDANIHRYSVAMDNCGSGGLAGIGAGDTIHAINFMWYYETDGGGSDDYGIRIRCSDDGGSPWTNDNIDDPKDPTWINSYRTITPVGENAWTQAYVDSLEMGMATVSSGGKELWFYSALAMVAFEPAVGGQTLYGSAVVEAEGNVQAHGKNISRGSSQIDASSSIAAVGSRLIHDSARIEAFSTVTAAVRRYCLGKSVIQASGELSATARLDALAKSIIASAGELSAAARLQAYGSVVIEALGDVVANATLVVPGGEVHYASAVIEAIGAIVGVASRLIFDSAELSASGGMAVVARNDCYAAGRISGLGSISTAARNYGYGRTIIDIQSSLAAVAFNLCGGKAAIAANGGITANGYVIISAQALIEALGDIIASATLVEPGGQIRYASAVIEAVGSVQAVGSRLVHDSTVIEAVSELTGRALLEAVCRTIVEAQSGLSCKAAVDQYGRAIIIAEGDIIATASLLAQFYPAWAMQNNDIFDGAIVL